MRATGRGQGVVEFALAITVFFLLTFGIVEGGRLIFTDHEISNAAREGARYAIANGSESTTPISTVDPIVAHLQRYITGLDPTDMTVQASWPGDASLEPACAPGGNGPGCPVTVVVTYIFHPIVPMIFGSNGITLTASSTMRIHY